MMGEIHYFRESLQLINNSVKKSKKRNYNFDEKRMPTSSNKKMIIPSNIENL